MACCLVLPQPAATGHTRTPACGSDEVPMATTAALDGDKTVTGIVAAWTWGTAPCVLDARLTFVVKRFAKRVSPGGAIRTIRGNPGVARMRAVLSPGAVLTASWRWRNWCGRSGRFQLQPSFSRWPYLAVRSPAIRPPPCNFPAARSTLVRVPVRLRRCSATDSRVHAAVGGGFMQSLIVGLRIGLRTNRSACLLTRASVALTLQERVAEQWEILQVAGNPGRRTLGAVLSPGGEPAQALWAWRNWCSRGGPFRLLAHVGGRTVAGTAVTDAPSCQDPSSPSTLAPSFGHG